MSERLERVFDLFPRLQERPSQQAGTLSGGEQQMLAIGRALWPSRALLLLDEPSMGLAPIMVRDIFASLRTLNEEGLTMVLVEQDARIALSLAHRGLVMERGRIVLADTAQALLDNPEVQAIYFGQRRAVRQRGRWRKMNEIWNPEYETMSRDELRELQFKRLQMTLRWAYDNVPFHRERWSALKLKPGDIRSLDDLRKLPFTVKSDFKAAYPYGLFALPLEKVIRIHASSGTISNPTVVGYSRGDLNTWSELCARVAVAGGARSHDVAQISVRVRSDHRGVRHARRAGAGGGRP